MALDPSQLTPSGGNCPDVAQILEQMAQDIRNNQCNTQAQIKAYIDRLERVMSQRLAVIEGSDELTTVLSQLQSLYATLDVNDDGELNDLIGFQNSLETLSRQVAAINGDFQRANDAIQGNINNLSDYKLVTNATLAQHDTRLSNNEVAVRNAIETAAAAQTSVVQANDRAITAQSTATQNTGLIEGLREDLSNIASSEALEQRAQQVECAVYRRLDTAFTAFQEAIMVDCGHFPSAAESNSIAPVTPSSEGDGLVL